MNCTEPGQPAFNFPSFTYNNLNDIVSYTSSGTTQYLWRDPMGRVFRKANYSGVQDDPATHYYYTFDALAQEYDFYLQTGTLHDDLDFDYLRRFNGKVLRQRDIDATSKDRQPVHDVLGSPVNLIDGNTATMSGTTSGYTFDAWGQSFAAGNAQAQPQETNHIRYHGAFTEEFVSSGDTDGIYRMGARHYSTVLGRFLQKEPLNLAGSPSVFYPLSSNDYIYCGNSPTIGSDISGLDSSMGLGSTMNTGILYPPEKPGPATPDEPLPDPDPWFTPIQPLVAWMPGFEPPTLPPWDRRFPQIPHPSLWDIMMDVSAPPGAMPAPIFPLPGGRSRPWANGPVAGRGGRGKFPLPEPMGASSGGGGGSSGSGGSSGYEKEFKYWPPGSFWGLAGDHAQKGPIDTGSGNSDSHFRMPNYGFVSMGASYGSGREQVQSEADFDKNWKNQGLSGNIRKTVAVATLIAMAAAVIGWYAAPVLGRAIVGVGRGVLSGLRSIGNLLTRGYDWFKSNIFRYDSWGKWKQRFRRFDGTRVDYWRWGKHFHLGSEGTLGKFHLPYQWSNWLKAWANLQKSKGMLEPVPVPVPWIWDDKDD